MPNPNPKLENLTSYKPKWQSGQTRTIRVPVAIADKVLEIAHQIDEGKFSDTSDKQPNSIPFDEPPSFVRLEVDNMSDTSELIDKKLARTILSDGLAVPSNKGGEIKTYLAKLGRMLGFEVEKNSKKQWVITDTSK